jgi:drug/metabolite transporter (DMT)-like permease
VAVLAALSFGATIPVLAHAGHGVGPCTTAALLYAGAALSTAVLRWVAPSSGAPLLRAQWGRLALIGLLGAGVAPTLLAWGLQRTGALTASLLLNLEAAATVLLAWAFYREAIGRRVALALALMTLGGVALTLATDAASAWSAAGALAIAGATVAWALDNTLTRGLALQDPVVIVAIKGTLGAALTGAVAVAMGESFPRARTASVLLACGATGYGLSLRLYLLAQRQIGAARTASIFAVAPFFGAALAFAWGERTPGLGTGVALALFAVGVLLHVTERHSHPHRHLDLWHDHAHSHDDGHHDHVHSPPFLGSHAHLHHHAPVEHEHPHGLDIHHEHVHT